jgi:histidyl-tRNA synthetase
MEYASLLRRSGLKVELDYLQRSVKAQMREANKLNARFTLFIGGDEFKEGLVTIKNMASSEEKKIGLDKIRDFNQIITSM